MTLTLSVRAENIVQAEIRTMSIECEKVGGINLAQGISDTQVPFIVRKNAQAAIDNGVNSYTRYDGLPELRAAIARKMQRYNGIKADQETEISVSSGSTGAFYCACLSLLNAGDEVILFEPYYGYHVNTLLSVEAAPTYVTMEAPDWTFKKEQLEKAVTDRTKGIVVCTPANPSGKVFTRQEIEWIAEIAISHDLFIFTDEIYEFFLYEGKRHLSPGSLPEIADRTITISGFSKTFSITGWRVGYSVSQARWAQMIGYMNDLVYVCAPAPLQFAVAAGIDDLESCFYRDLASAYQKKRDRLCTALRRASLPPCVPQGAYYVLADVTRLPGKTSKDKAMHLLKETGVASVPGESFFHGSGGHNLVRFCFSKNDAELEQACKRIEMLS